MFQAHSSFNLLHSFSPRSATLAAITSVGGLAFSKLEAWPLWVTGLAVVLPWMPVVVRELAWVYGQHQWLALFYVLVVTQSGHLLEHVAQMIQIHVLGLQGVDARGVFGSLDIEWVHFMWNTWVIFAVLVLLARFASNRWLLLTAFLAGWHEVEHTQIFSVYLLAGISGSPGLLSQGGMIAGGLPIMRPDLHFLYNLIETMPLALGFFRQVKRTGPD